MKAQLLASLFLLLLLGLPFVAAAVDFNQGISSDDEETFDEILTPVMKIYNLVKYIATALSGVVLLVAGLNYIISGSNPGKRESAKSMAMYVVIGLLVIWAAPLVVKFLVG